MQEFSKDTNREIPILGLKDFSYELPDSLIAQVPSAQRDASRLLIADAQNLVIKDADFVDLPQVINDVFQLKNSAKKALLILNDSQVYPARIRVRRASGARGEVFLLETGEKSSYRALLRPLKKFKASEILYADNADPLAPLVPLFKIENLESQLVSPVEKSLDKILEMHGEMPLPPYIVRDPARVGSHAGLDNERYQTVYSQVRGSAAAPTAGLHFTPEVLSECRENSIEFAHVTLHVGLGTFQPVQTEAISEHKMHEEHYKLPLHTLEKIREYVRNDWPIIFVGTTSLRTVESFFRKSLAEIPTDFGKKDIKELVSEEELYKKLSTFADSWHSTQLFIRPESKVEKIFPKIGNAILTNFHQPESTLVMLVSALLGYDFWKNVYQYAVEKKYRFLSYGDSSLLIFRLGEKA